MEFFVVYVIQTVNNRAIHRNGGASMGIDKQINNGRQIELDLAKALAILFMVMIHTQLVFGTLEVNESNFGVFIDYLGGVPAAPMFMFLLGVGIVYSTKTGSELVKRGAKLFALSYGLNLLRAIPAIVWFITEPGSLSLQEIVIEFVTVDILQFAGLAMMSFGLLRKWRWKWPWLFVIAIICSLLQGYLSSNFSDETVMSIVTGLVYGANENSYFPYLTWIFYPIAGFSFGQFLITCENKRRLYQWLLPMSFILAIVLTWTFNWYLEIPNAMTSDTLYYHHGLSDQLPYTAFVIAEISVLFFVSQWLPTRVIKVTKRWSRNVTKIFIIHWTLLMWLTFIITENSFEWLGVSLIFSIVLLISDVFAQKMKRKGEMHK